MQVSVEKNESEICVKKINNIKCFEPTYHYQMELMYIVSGKLEMCIDSSVETLSSGDMAVVFPYEVHSVMNSKQCDVIAITFDPSLSDVFEKKISHTRPKTPFIKKASRFYDSVEKLRKFSSKKVPEGSVMSNIYLLALLGEVLYSMELIDIETGYATTTQKILRYCSEHYTEHITIKKVSEALYISESSVTKIFSGKLKTSFRDYINMLRVNKAKYYLEKTDKRVTEVMKICGFRNQSTFNRVFLSICGITPSQVKKQTKKVPSK